jgi:hypothetical protein
MLEDLLLSKSSSKEDVEREGRRSEKQDRDEKEGREGK